MVAKLPQEVGYRMKPLAIEAGVTQHLFNGLSHHWHLPFVTTLLVIPELSFVAILLTHTFDSHTSIVETILRHTPRSKFRP